MEQARIYFVSDCISGSMGYIEFDDLKKIGETCTANLTNKSKPDNQYEAGRTDKAIWYVRVGFKNEDDLRCEVIDKNVD